MLPAFFINLASRPDRLEHITRQLAMRGLTAERIEAVTPADFPPQLEARRKSGAVTLNAGEIGCSMSHQKVWRLMVERRIPAALILEDDVLLSEAVPKVLSDPGLLAHGAEAIQLESRRTAALIGRPVPTTAPGVTQNRLMSSSFGTAAYVMTMGLAEKLLDRRDLDTLSVDSLLFGRAGGVFYESRIHQMIPALAIQLDQTAQNSDVGRSDLSHQRPGHKADRSRALVARLQRLRVQLGHHARVLTTFASSGDLWGARHLKLPIAPDLRALM